MSFGSLRQWLSSFAWRSTFKSTLRIKFTNRCGNRVIIWWWNPNTWRHCALWSTRTVPSNIYSRSYRYLTSCFWKPAHISLGYMKIWIEISVGKFKKRRIQTHTLTESGTIYSSIWRLWEILERGCLDNRFTRKIKECWNPLPLP